MGFLCTQCILCASQGDLGVVFLHGSLLRKILLPTTNFNILHLSTAFEMFHDGGLFYIILNKPNHSNS